MLENLGENSWMVLIHPTRVPCGEKGLTKAEKLVPEKEGRPVAVDDCRHI